MAKRMMSLALSLALLLSCISGITLFTAADELPAPFGEFSFGGGEGATSKTGGVVRYINETETNNDIPSGMSIGDTGKYGYTVNVSNQGLYYGGTILNNVPDGTSVTFAVEYYIDSAVALAGEMLMVTDGVHGEALFSDLPVGQQGVLFYTLSADEVDSIQANEYGGDMRLRIKIRGEAVGKLYITGAKILDTTYSGVNADVVYAYFDFGAVGTCPYYPEAVVTQSKEMSMKDAEVGIPEGFEGYRYFSLATTAAAYSESDTANKPVFVKVYTKAGYEDTSIPVDTYQVYGEKSDGSKQATHNPLIVGAPSAPVFIVEDGVGTVLMPVTCLRNGAGPGSFRFKMSEAAKIARIEVYDVATYCATENVDAAVKAEIHNWMKTEKWNVTLDGYQAPSLDAEGFTGTIKCGVCGDVLAEGETIAKSTAYAQLDFTSGEVKSTAVKNFYVTNSSGVQYQKIPGTNDYAMAIVTHNDGLIFALDADQLAIDEEDLLNGTELAITVEYYVGAVHDGNMRIAFETANSKMMAFYKSWGGTCWDAVCVNQDAALNADKTSIATFTVGKDITYIAPKGQFGGNDKFEEPREVETLTIAKALTNGTNIALRGWGGKVSADSPIYIKSITICDAAELGAATGGAADHYYTDFEGVATNPYYPQYTSPSNNGITTATDTVEWYDTDAEKAYPRFNYTYVRMPSALLTTYENFKATPVKLVIERKEGSDANGMTFQYQCDRSDASDSSRWSSTYTINFDENGKFEMILWDATFMNGLNGSSSIRLRDLHYVRSGSEEEGYTYAVDTADDIAGIATIRVYSLSNNCEVYHDQFTESNKNLVWLNRVEPTYDQTGYSGDLVCAHCGEVFQEGEELAQLGDYAQLDFSDGTMKQTAIAGVRPIAGGTSLTPVQIPGTDSYGLKLITHNDGIALKLNEFGGFTPEDIENGREIAISVEYYISNEVENGTRIAFDPQKGSDKIMALYTNYSGTTWDSAVLNAGAPMPRGQLNVATFTVGKNVDYVTGPGQFGAANKFTDPVSVNTNEFAQAIVNGGEILIRGWNVSSAKLDDPATEEDESAPERVVYIKSITVYDAKDVVEQEIDTTVEFIDYVSEFVASPVYYPQYKQVGSAYGITGSEVLESYRDDGSDVTYVYYKVTDSLKSAEQDVNPVVIRFTFREGCEREEINFAYQTAAPWTYVTLDIVDGVAESVLDDAAFTNGLNGKASFRLSNDSADPLVDDIARIEVFVIKDNSALLDLLAEAEDAVKFKTPASVEAYLAVVAEAQAVADDAWATEEEIAEAVAAMEAAAALLVDCDHSCGTEAVGYVAETCLSDGYTGDLACIDCGYVAEENKGTVIPRHTTRLINVKDASCKEAGNSGDLWCDVCQKIVKPGSSISKLPHSWDEGKVTKEATATEYGEFTKTCTVCGETIVTRLEFQAALGDVDGNGKVDSTDARLILQFAVKKIAPTALDLDVADVNGDDKVDSTDARLVLQYAVKKIDKLPAAK